VESCLLGKEFDPVSKMLAFGTGFLFPDKLVHERVFYCTKSRLPGSPVHRWGIFCTGSDWSGRLVPKLGIFCTGSCAAENPVQKRVFFCTKAACWGSGGADGRHLLFLAVFLLILHFV